MCWLSSLLLVALFALWQPIGGVVWRVPEARSGRMVVIGLYLLRLGAAALHDLPDRPFRPVRPQAGVAQADAARPIARRSSTRRASTGWCATRSTSAG